MNFEEFEKRYKAQMEARGYRFGEDPEADAEFREQMSAVYLGLSVYANFQREQALEQIEADKRARQQNKPSIILPGMGH